jgi:hypothetical protein
MLMQDLLDDKHHAFVIEFLVMNNNKIRVYAWKRIVLWLFECPQNEALGNTMVTVQRLPVRKYKEGLFMEHVLVGNEHLATIDR